MSSCTALTYTQSVTDVSGTISATFTPAASSGVLLSSVQLHVSKNCASVMPGNPRISTSSGVCPTAWYQPPFDETQNPVAQNLIAYTSNAYGSNSYGASYDATTGSYTFSLADTPLDLSSGDVICYDFTYDTASTSCNTGICNVGAPTAPPTSAPFIVGVRGDPQFNGFQGQAFQVHGVSGNVYNLFSSAKLQVNAQFVFLDEGHCDKSMNTLCYSHPGSYISAVGIQFKQGTYENATQILLESGRWNQGLHAHVNGRDSRVGSAAKHLLVKGASMAHTSNSQIKINTAALTMTVTNSDRFLNLDMELVDTFLTAENVASCEWPVKRATYDEPNGLMGNTWCQRAIESDKLESNIDDYVVADGIFGKSFQFNKFQ